MSFIPSLAHKFQLLPLPACPLHVAITTWSGFGGKGERPIIWHIEVLAKFSILSPSRKTNILKFLVYSHWIQKASWSDGE